jgi:Zn-dependent metalloprotease
MKILKMFLIALITWSFLMGQVMAGEDSDASDTSLSIQEEHRTLIDQLSRLTATQVKIKTDHKTGKVSYLGVDPSSPIRQPGRLGPNPTPEEAARGFLSTYGALFGLKDQVRELKVMRTKQADRGRSFVRFQQVHSGIPVFGGELIVQTESFGNIISAQGKILPDIRMDTSPAIGSEIAREKAIQLFMKAYRDKPGINPSSLQVSRPELWIYNPLILALDENRTYLVWRMEVTPKELVPIRELVLIDALAGNVILHFNQIDGALSRKIYDRNNTPTPDATLPGYPSDLKRYEGQGESTIADVNSAYDYAGDTYNFYSTYHGRDSIDNAGMELISTTRYCAPSEYGYPCPFPNAFWNGFQMAYGQDFASADDVVAHEMTHGVTEHESGLIYYAQSGAINEAFSDIWGEFVDLTNGKGNDTDAVRWLCAEDLPIGAIRSLSNPPAYGSPDSVGSPNHYCGSFDNGGVHINSGILNKTAYLMTDGGTFNGFTVAGLGIPKVAKIFYEAQTNLLTSAGDFNALYHTLNQACANLVGTNEITASDCQEVEKATLATRLDKQPWRCTGLFDPDFEGGPWVGWGEYSSRYYDIVTYDPSEAYSGDWCAWLGGYDYAEDYIYQEIQVPSDATQAYLQFWYHITTQETGSGAYDKMYVALFRDGGDGYLYLVRTLATLSNAKKTTGWVQSPKVSLSSYKGKSLYLLFLVLNDGSYPTYFWVDAITLMPVFGYPPLVSSFKINGTATSTPKAVVKLNNSTKNKPTHYMASEDQGFAGASWLPYATAPLFTLSGGVGTKTVYFKVKNRFDESAVVSDTISTLAPTATLKINNGASSTTKQEVKLNNTVKNYPTHYMVSELPTFEGAGWQVYTRIPVFTLSPGGGTKTVHFKVKNGFDESPPVSDDILLTP